MTLALVAACVVVAFLVWFEWWGRKPLVHKGIKTSELGRFFRVLLEPGQEGGLMFLRPTGAPKKDHFLQFVRYGPDGQQGIRFAFPRAPWSQDIFDRVAIQLKERSYPVLTEDTGEAVVQQFAIVNLGSDVTQASDLTAAALQAMGWEDCTVNVWFEGVGPGPKRI